MVEVLNNTNNIYAPIIIPTLSRYKHLKKCIESLEACTYANQSDIIIGLDYPPSEKYIDGWKKTSDYLQRKKNDNAFKSFKVIIRTSNCGVSGPESNLRLMINDIQKSHEYYIVTEDDNIFSPCFLDFMNKILIEYKADESITSVCGYNQHTLKRYPPYQLLKSFDASAWGMGQWTSKEKKLPIWSQNYGYDVLCEKKMVFKILFTYPICLLTLYQMLKQHLNFGDTKRTVHNICENKYQIRPNVSLVRNCGHDGSGVNCIKQNVSFIEQVISDQMFFNVDLTCPLVNVSKFKMFFTGMKRRIYAPLYLIKCLVMMTSNLTK